MHALKPSEPGKSGSCIVNSWTSSANAGCDAGYRIQVQCIRRRTRAEVRSIAETRVTKVNAKTSQRQIMRAALANLAQA